MLWEQRRIGHAGETNLQAWIKLVEKERENGKRDFHRNFLCERKWKEKLLGFPPWSKCWIINNCLEEYILTVIWWTASYIYIWFLFDLGYLCIYSFLCNNVDLSSVFIFKCISSSSSSFHTRIYIYISSSFIFFYSFTFLSAAAAASATSKEWIIEKTIISLSLLLYCCRPATNYEKIQLLVTMSPSHSILNWDDITSVNYRLQLNI